MSLIARIPLSFARKPIAAAGSLLFLSSVIGCGLGGGNVTSTAGAPVTASLAGITGRVHGGQQPVSGATIQLYAVGATGYTSLATPLLTTAVTTNPQGFFSITGDYTCPAGSYVYITGSGGNAGTGTNTDLALMAALGSCSNLLAHAASTYIYMDEVTTVAAAYAMAQFSGGTAFGTSLVSKPGVSGSAAPADNFATSATNIQGVANAMAVANVLANTGTGTSPGTNTNGTATVESYTVNTIADILAYCVNSAGGTGTNTPCGSLFADATPTGGAAPGDTIQVALELALHPGDANLLAGTPTGSTLDGLISPQAPFVPYVNTSVAGNTIPDWTIAISYNPVTPNTTTPLLSKTSGVAIDGYGNAWVTSAGNGYVVELAPNGDPIQAGATAGTYYVDSYNVSGTPMTVVGGNTANTGTVSFYGVALDNENNAWASDYGGGYLFRIGASGASFGTSGEVATANGGVASTIAMADSYTTGVQSGAHPTGIALDNNDNLYSSLYGNGGSSPSGASGAACGSASAPFTAGTKNIITFAKVSGTTSPTYGTGVIGNSGGSNAPFIAIDNGTSDVANSTVIPGSPFVYDFGEASASGEAHPGAGHYGLLFQSYTVTNTTAGSIQGCNTPIGSITSAGYTGSATTKIAQNANSGDATDLFNNGYAVAFDAQNNFWTANSMPTDANGTITTSFTKLTLNYGTSFTSANASADSTFATYDTGGMLATGEKPFDVAVDGNSSIFADSNGTAPIVTAITNTGAGLAPSSTGFTGATYSAGGATAGSTENTRAISTAGTMAIDPSGNLWVTSGAAVAAGTGTPAVVAVPATNIVQIVGLAAPVKTPTATAVGGSLGIKP